MLLENIEGISEDNKSIRCPSCGMVNELGTGESASGAPTLTIIERFFNIHCHKENDGYTCDEYLATARRGSHDFAEILNDRGGYDRDIESLTCPKCKAVNNIIESPNDEGTRMVTHIAVEK